MERFGQILKIFILFLDGKYFLGRENSHSLRIL